MKVLYIAPGNSIHSKKWIETINSLYPNEKYFWYSFEKFTFSIDKRINYFQNQNFSNHKLINLIKSLYVILKLQITYKFDLVHIHSIGTYSLFSLIPIIFRIPYIATPWGSDIIFGSRNLVKKIILSFVLNQAKLTTCDAVHISKLIKKICPKAKPQIINFGIDTSFFASTKKNEFNNETFFLLSNRNHEHIYNLKTLIKSAKLLKENNIKFKLTVSASGTETPYLKKLSKKFGLKNDINFTGRYDYDDLPEILNLHHIYISTSLSDAGIASSIAEAMACQRIVIVSDSGENKSWISDGKNGFLFKTGSAKSLFNAIIKAIKYKKNWIQIGLNARKTISSRNDIYNEMHKMYALMKSISKD